MTPIEQIKAAIRLDEYASRYLVIKNKKANCPFHKERSASLAFHGKYAKCFGCGWSGDVIAFAAAYHGLSTREAVRMLAAEANVQLTRQPQAHPYDAAKAQRERAEAEEWRRRAKAALVASLHSDDYGRVLPFLEALDRAHALTAYRAQRTPEQAVTLREAIREADLWVKTMTPLVERLLTA